MYSYAQIEAALARIHDIDAARIGSFRGRLQHYRRIGLVPGSPGRGQKLSYEIIDVRLWALCLELAQLGVDPTAIKRIVDTWRPQILEAFARAEVEPESLFIAVKSDFVTSPPAPEGEEQPMRWIQLWRESEISMRELKIWLGRRILLFDLTKMVHDLDKALSAEAEGASNA